MSLTREIFLELTHEFTINDKGSEYGITDFLIARDPATQAPRAFVYSYAYLNGGDDISFHVLELPAGNDDVAAIRKETLNSARLAIIKDRFLQPLMQEGIGALDPACHHRILEQEHDIFFRTVAAAMDVAAPESASSHEEAGVSKASFNKDGSFSIAFKPR